MSVTSHDRHCISNHRQRHGLFNLCSGVHQRNIKSPRYCRWPMDSLNKGPVARNVFPVDDVIMAKVDCVRVCHGYFSIPGVNWRIESGYISTIKTNYNKILCIYTVEWICICFIFRCFRCAFTSYIAAVSNSGLCLGIMEYSYIVMFTRDSLLTQRKILPWLCPHTCRTNDGNFGLRFHTVWHDVNLRLCFDIVEHYPNMKNTFSDALSVTSACNSVLV